MNLINPSIETEKSILFGLNHRDRETIFTIFKKFPMIKQVKIFGSRVNGKFKKGSDIDLALMDKNLDENLIHKLRIDFEESSLPYNVDLVDYNSIHHSELKNHIDRVGIIFYQS